MNTPIRSINSALMLLLVLAPGAGRAQVPARLPVQGFLQDAEGAPVNGQTPITVALYDAPTGGESLFSEVQVVNVIEGRFVIYAGLQMPLDWSVLDSQGGLWIGLTISDDDELVPRFELGTVPFAARAEDAQTLQGATPADFATVNHQTNWGDITGVPAGLDDGDADTLASLNCLEGQVVQYTAQGWSCAADQGLLVVDTADIVDGAVTQAKIAANGVGAAQVQAGAITGAKLAASSVSASHIAADAVRASEIAANAVGPSEIATNAVGSAEITANAVGASEIAANAVGASELASNSVGTAELINGAVTAEKLSLSSNVFCVTSGSLRVVTGQNFCALNSVPAGVTCLINQAGNDFHVFELPAGSSNCCVRCF